MDAIHQLEAEFRDGHRAEEAYDGLPHGLEHGLGDPALLLAELDAGPVPGQLDLVLVARKGDDGAALRAGALEGEVEDADDDVAEVGALVDLADDVEDGPELGERGGIDRDFVPPALWHRPNSILNSC